MCTQCHARAACLGRHRASTLLCERAAGRQQSVRCEQLICAGRAEALVGSNAATTSSFARMCVPEGHRGSSGLLQEAVQAVQRALAAHAVQSCHPERPRHRLVGGMAEDGACGLGGRRRFCHFVSANKAREAAAARGRLSSICSVRGVGLVSCRMHQGPCWSVHVTCIYNRWRMPCMHPAGAHHGGGSARKCEAVLLFFLSLYCNSQPGFLRLASPAHTFCRAASAAKCGVCAYMPHESVTALVMRRTSFPTSSPPMPAARVLLPCMCRACLAVSSASRQFAVVTAVCVVLQYCVCVWYVVKCFFAFERWQAFVCFVCKSSSLRVHLHP